MALHAADRDRRIVPDHLRRDLRHDLGDDRVDLPRHDRAALLELGQEDLGQPGARARAHEAEIVRDLGQRDGDGLQRARRLDEPVARRLRLERVGRRARSCRPVSSDSRARTRSANSGCVFRPVPTAVPPSGIWPSRGNVSRDARDALAHLRRVAAELLAERHGHRVHPVGAARLDDVVELARLRLERRARASSSAGSSSFDDLAERGEVHRGREDVVDDWPMLTSSFAWTSSPASEAITSFAFMFDDVPEPVWNTSIGNWSSSSPSAIRRRVGDPLRLVLVEEAVWVDFDAFGLRVGVGSASVSSWSSDELALACFSLVLNRLRFTSTRRRPHPVVHPSESAASWLHAFGTDARMRTQRNQRQRRDNFMNRKLATKLLTT